MTYLPGHRFPTPPAPLLNHSHRWGWGGEEGEGGLGPCPQAVHPTSPPTLYSARRVSVAHRQIPLFARILDLFQKPFHTQWPSPLTE